MSLALGCGPSMSAIRTSLDRKLLTLFDEFDMIPV